VCNSIRNNRNITEITGNLLDKYRNFQKLKNNERSVEAVAQLEITEKKKLWLEAVSEM
jgi:hypothetical protein